MLPFQKLRRLMCRLCGNPAAFSAHGQHPIVCKECAFQVCYDCVSREGRGICPNCKTSFDHVKDNEKVGQGRRPYSAPPPLPSPSSPPPLITNLNLSLTLPSISAQPPLPSACDFSLLWDTAVPARNNHAASSSATTMQGPPSRGAFQTTEAEDVPHPPYPWAAPESATSSVLLKSLAELQELHIYNVRGAVRCKVCQHREVHEYDIKGELAKIARTISEFRLNDRAPSDWVVRAKYLRPCPACAGRTSARGLLCPVIPENVEDIDWLFLLASKALGACNLAQLKYFTRRAGKLRTAAKDRLLLLTYTGLCQQLDPSFAPCWLHH